jgi:hypothetical protein
MKSPKIIFASVILLTAFNICFGQDKPKAEIIDQFDEINCEELLARLDNFLIAMRNNPNAAGYIIISGGKNDKNSFRDEWRIRGHLEFRRFDDSQLTIAKAEVVKDSYTKFWLVPAGAEKPEYKEIDFDYKIPENRKPYIFNSTKEDGDLCPGGNQLKIYSDYLSANPNFRGHIVIFTESKAEFEKERTKLFNELTNKYKIPADQIKFFFVKKKEFSYNEFWLVPQKKRN